MKSKQASGKRGLCSLRWIAMIPLALGAFFFKFMMAGYGFTALVLCCIIAVLLFYNLMDILRKRYPRQISILRRLFTVCLCIGLLIVGITEYFIIEASLGDPKENCDYLVVLGAKVRHDGPSVSLMDRICGAYDYLSTHPDVVAVVSGGQGADEPMSEGLCIYAHLVAMGIDEHRIWVEDQAASTWANLNYSLDLIQEKTGTRPTKLGILSSEYHMLRAGMLARDCGVEPVLVPATTSLISQRINHFMREVAGVWHYILLGGHYD